jgi:hypothetical protein
MAFPDNRPQLDQLKGYLKHIDVTAWSDPELQQQLDNSIAWVEDVCTTSFNGRQVVELYDGNTTNQIVIRKRPVTSVIALSVETPILGYIRVYAPTEIKLYRKQGVAKVFTYKLAVEQAMFNTLDYQAWGTIFPPLPQAVHVTYTYGYPSYDAGADRRRSTTPTATRSSSPATSATPRKPTGSPTSSRPPSSTPPVPSRRSSAPRSASSPR